MDADKTRFPCIACGWCCRLVPCHLQIYMTGEAIEGPCPRIKEVSPGIHKCGRMTDETNPAKREALKRLLLIDNYCSHKWGPYPAALMFHFVHHFPDEEIKKRGPNLYADLKRHVEIMRQESHIPDAALDQAATDLELAKAGRF